MVEEIAGKLDCFLIVLNNTHTNVRTYLFFNSCYCVITSCTRSYNVRRFLTIKLIFFSLNCFQMFRFISFVCRKYCHRMNDIDNSKMNVRVAPFLALKRNFPFYYCYLIFQKKMLQRDGEKRKKNHDNLE